MDLAGIPRSECSSARLAGLVPIAVARTSIACARNQTSVDGVCEPTHQIGTVTFYGTQPGSSAQAGHHLQGERRQRRIDYPWRRVAHCHGAKIGQDRQRQDYAEPAVDLSNPFVKIQCSLPSRLAKKGSGTQADQLSARAWSIFQPLPDGSRKLASTDP